MDLGLVLLSALQSLLHLLGHVLAGVGPVQEAAAAVLLHHLSSREARQFAEAVRAVDDGVATVTLGVTQQEIAVCRGVGEREGGSGGMEGTDVCIMLKSDVWYTVCRWHWNQSLLISLNLCQSFAGLVQH